MLCVLCCFLFCLFSCYCCLFCLFSLFCCCLLLVFIFFILFVNVIFASGSEASHVHGKRTKKTHSERSVFCLRHNSCFLLCSCYVLAIVKKVFFMFLKHLRNNSSIVHRLRKALEWVFRFMCAANSKFGLFQKYHNCTFEELGNQPIIKKANGFYIPLLECLAVVKVQNS